MTRLNSFGARTTLQTPGGAVEYVSLPALEAAGFPRVAKLPYSLRILLENLLRNEDGAFVKKDDIAALASWDPARAAPSARSRSSPARVLLQDFTGVPAVVDLAAMRDGVVDARRRPEARSTRCSRSTWSSTTRCRSTTSASRRASQLNVELEFERNRERYEFLRWGQKAFENFRVVPPGTGIVHQVNLEYLARVVCREDVDGGRSAYPRHAGRHRLAHDDGQRPRRGRLGRRRHRGRGRDARPADRRC